jgi:hypothetical protein
MCTDNRVIIIRSFTNTVLRSNRPSTRISRDLCAHLSSVANRIPTLRRCTCLIVHEYSVAFSDPLTPVPGNRFPSTVRSRIKKQISCRGRQAMRVPAGNVHHKPTTRVCTHRAPVRFTVRFPSPFGTKKIK